MKGPAAAGALIYAKSLATLSDYYQQVLGMTLQHVGDEFHVISCADGQLVVHAIPPAIAASIEISRPPALREEQAVKLFYTVPSLAQAAQRATALGGGVFGSTYQGPGFRMTHAFDPEGNILQLREWSGA